MHTAKRIVEKTPPTKKDDLILITGAGGFIGGNLALHFKKKGFTNIRAVDRSRSMNGISMCPAWKISAST